MVQEDGTIVRGPDSGASDRSNGGDRQEADANEATKK